MTPRESEVLQVLGLTYLGRFIVPLIFVFFDGASSGSSLEVRDSSTCSITGVFLVLFSASVVIFAFVSCKDPYSLARSDPPKSHRRRGFSSRATAAMFATTATNLLLFTLNTGLQVTELAMNIQPPLNPDTGLPLSEISIPRPELVGKVVWNMVLVAFWVSYLPVSIKLLPSDSVSICAHWRYGSAISSSFGGLGSSSKIDSG